MTSTLLVIWILAPLALGFGGKLFAALLRPALIAALAASAAVACLLLLAPPVAVELIDSAGVRLLADARSGWFVLTNVCVSGAVVLRCWRKGSDFLLSALLILHGSLNAAFISADLISLYVAIEVIGVAAFLLIAHPRTERAVWIGLRYLLVGNVAMLLYLVGVAFAYRAAGHFGYEALAAAPSGAVALMLVGLLVKGGIFLGGMWLPGTHGEVETPVSAMLSGIAVKAGVLPLLVWAETVPALDPTVRLLGVATALWGVGHAVLERDVKRMLAFHTVSQLGFILAAPAVGGLYALAHGLVKSGLFLAAGELPGRDLYALKTTPIPTRLWVVFLLLSCSISGLPLFLGFGAKALTTAALLPWQELAMTVAATGTAVSFAKLIFLPRGGDGAVARELWPAVGLLLAGLLLGNALAPGAYSLAAIGKALVTVAAGWLAYALVFRRLKIKLPRSLERLDHLLGMMVLLAMALLGVLGR